MRELAQGYTQTRVFMDTVVSIELSAGHCLDEEGLLQLIGRAFAWFAEVERRCSRFDESSELRCLSRSIGRPVAVSPFVNVVQLQPGSKKRTGTLVEVTDRSSRLDRSGPATAAI